MQGLTELQACLHSWAVTRAWSHRPCVGTVKLQRATAGIFVNDILDAVPIDKFFELFKPGAGGEGGFIRISINFVKDLKDIKDPAGVARGCPTSTPWCNAQGLGAGALYGLYHAQHALSMLNMHALPCLSPH